MTVAGFAKSLSLFACFAMPVAFAGTSASTAKVATIKPTSAPAAGTVRITSIERAIYHGRLAGDDEARCKRWRLTARQAVRFFQLSQRYDENPYRRFYQASCVISGKLVAEGKTWRFAIDGGGTATWQREGEVRHWGCRARRCEPLVMLLTDFMEG